ncbi:hypothetical protein EMPS_10607 [Entomortierella parvispora]|uniref:Uncharacterized protein n=1 Tax=Entomortierella parvispora TaxID=205924 RepID=A0A9P3M1F8_9FUNG|nr:hypothetical protein EMPS_10607 [Entomortierella parvispora]
MASVYSSSSISFSRPPRSYSPSPSGPRKNSMMNATVTPVLSSFAIDLIAQFDSYRVSMRESLQREVEENIHKARVLKEAMKETSDLDTELLISEEDAEHSRASNGLWAPHGHSNSSLQLPQTEKNEAREHSVLETSGGTNLKVSTMAGDKRSRLDRIFGRKPSVTSSRASVTAAPAEQRSNPNQSAQNRHVPIIIGPSAAIPGGQPSAARNSSAANLSELRYLSVEEDSEEEPGSRLMDRGAEVIQPFPQDSGREVKLHPTRAKTFALPKSLRNLKRRIAALRAKGTDLDAEKRERDDRERRDGSSGPGVGEEKKKFTLIRLLPWKSSKRTAAVDITVPAHY